MAPRNPRITSHQFLESLYDDGYFPTRLIDKCTKFLLDLSEQIETEETSDLGALYRLGNLAVARFNFLIQDQFAEAGSEIATAAGEAICSEFEFIATAYGFPAADVEYMTADREW